MKTSSFLRLTAAAVLVLPSLALFPANARADVIPLDTFTFSLAGFNNTTGNGVFLTNGVLTGTFGLTQTFAYTPGGQILTLTSSETIGATTTTDSFTFSVPTSFVPRGSTFNGSGGNNQTINFIELDLGEGNGGTNTLDFLTAHPSVTATGSILYGSGSGTTFALTPGTTLSNNSRSLGAFEGVSYGTGDISTLDVRTFNISFSYATVPAAAATVPDGGTTFAMLGLGFVGLVGAHRLTGGRKALV